MEKDYNLKIIMNEVSLEQAIDNDALAVETLLNSSRNSRYHISSRDSPWKLVLVEKPEHCIEVLGYHPDWVDEDFNPDGICLCFLMDEGEWTVAKWCGLHDEWHTRLTGVKNWDKNLYETPLYAPIAWMPKPQKPV